MWGRALQLGLTIPAKPTAETDLVSQLKPKSGPPTRLARKGWKEGRCLDHPVPDYGQLL